MLQNITINAGQTLEFFEPGDFFRVLDAAAPLDLIFYRNGAEVGRAEQVGEGYAERFRGEGFDRYRITSASTQTIQFVGRLGNDVFYDKAPTGAVTLSGQQGAFTSAQVTVTSASTTIDAANAARRYLLIQNNDATGIVYVNLAGATATALNSLRLLPGESLELSSFVPSGAITAIGSIASNTNVVLVEG